MRLEAEAVTFATLAVPLQRAQVKSVDLWPVTAIGWDAGTATLLLTGTHYLAKVPMTAVPVGDDVEKSLALLWSVWTGTLPRHDLQNLEQRKSGYHWSTFKADMAVFVDWAAAARPDERAAVQAAAVAKVTVFHPEDASLRTASFEDFLGMLAWDLDVKPVLLRVALVHWLADWAARRAHKVLSLPDLVRIWDGQHRFPVEVGLTPPEVALRAQCAQDVGGPDVPRGPGGAATRRGACGSSGGGSPGGRWRGSWTGTGCG